MHDSIFISGRDTLLIAIPSIFMLAMCVLRLDVTLAHPQRSSKRRAHARGVDENGEPIFTDPDGRRVPTPRRTGQRQAGS